MAIFGEAHLSEESSSGFLPGQEVESINLAGLSHVISVTAVGSETDEKPRIYFRVYGTIAQVK